MEDWLAGQDGLDIYLTAISEAELRYGMAIMSNGKRREALAAAIDRVLREDIAGRILAFDSDAAEATRPLPPHAGQLDGRCPVGLPDRRHRACTGATVATRNTGDFEGCGIDLVNPGTKKRDRFYSVVG